MMNGRDKAMNQKTDFENWLYNGGTTSDSPGYINHAVQVLDSWLDEKLPDKNIGNLFRYTDYNSYSKELERIKQLPDFDIVNKSDQNGRTKAALNKYKEFLLQKNNGKKFEQKTFQEVTMKDQIEQYKKLLLNTHNIILHGAPGTGKTYLAHEIAEAMGCSDNEIGFVQFHPSYDYTDFVEGLRPVNDGGSGQISFERKDGVFKKFCEKALLSTSTSNDFLKDLNDNPTIWKVSLEGTGDNPTRKDCLENGYIRIGWHEYGDVVDFSKFDGYTEYGGSNVLVAFQHKMRVGDIVLSCWSSTEIDAIGIVTGEYEYRSEGGDYPRYRAVKWLVKGIKENIVERNNGKTLTLASVYKLSISMKDVLEIVSKYQGQNLPNPSTKNFVFIIDEINRGEMSKIFGELFFSIDPGYRGKDGLIKTQYQNLITESNVFYDGFYVPENVYIIGTMNDIDRNVESMDFAFRRRFTFKEITAKDTQEQILSGLDDSIREEATNRMDSLNDAISKVEGLSSSYHIGGAYFLKLKDLDNDFGKLWEYHLEGVLREYLRGMENAEDELKKLKEAYKNDNPMKEK